MNTFHLISHTHWDREWHQTFQQFRLKLVHMIDGLLDILDSDPAYNHFMMDGQTIVLEDYLQIRPQREDDLRRHIQSGRILIGPWYLMPDEFLTSPEAAIRNFIEGDRIARRFGPKMMVGYIPDTFGHIGQMPQILRGFGIQYASVWRGAAGGLPNEFWWQAPDGSRVLMGYLSQGYFNAVALLHTDPAGAAAEVHRQRDLLTANSAGHEFILMHGMDHQEASRATTAVIAGVNGKLNGDRLLHSTLPEYFSRVQASMDLGALPAVKGELRSSQVAPLLPGVLSSRMWLKQRNQECETLLEKWAEPFSAWARVYAPGRFGPETDFIRCPQDALRQAWRMLLQCHPHDSICGCSIDQVHDEMRSRFDQAEQIGAEVTRQSLEALGGAVNTLPPAALGAAASSIVIFNASSRPRSGAISVIINDLPESAGFELVDETGACVPFQTLWVNRGELQNMKIDRGMYQNMSGMLAPGMDIMGAKLIGIRVEGMDPNNPGECIIDVFVGQGGAPDPAEWEKAKQELESLANDPSISSFTVRMLASASAQALVNAQGIPAAGYRTLWIREAMTAVKEAQPAQERNGQASRRIENEYFTVELQPDCTLNIYDKRNDILYTGQNRFVDGGDRGDTYNYSAPEIDMISPVSLKDTRVERGSVQQTLEIDLEMRAPASLAADRKSRNETSVTLPITSRVTLTYGVERVEIHTEIDNLASDHRLRVHFTAPFAVETADYDGHFEIIRRPVGLPEFDPTWVEQPRPEQPQRAFTAISNGVNGLLIANRGLPEVEIIQAGENQSELALTLLRCVGWLSRDDFPERKGSAGPTIATPGAQMPGRWAFDYAVVPFHEAGRMAAYHQAYAFETPLHAVTTSLHDGVLPARGSFLQVEPGEFLISAVKMTEDGRGWLARGYNSGADPLAVTLKPLHPPASAASTDLLENPLNELAPGADGEIRLEVKAHELASIRFSAEN